MVKTKNKKLKGESDSVYLLKLVLYMVLGSLWIRVSLHDGATIPVPFGFILGYIFAQQEHFQIDRKIE